MVQRVGNVASMCAAYVTGFFKDKPPISNEAIHWQSDTVLGLYVNSWARKR